MTKYNVELTPEGGWVHRPMPDLSWISVDQMPTMPRGWYWAEWPGQWVFYSPERNQEQGIFHGTTSWVDLMSKRYWGPWTEPSQSQPST